MTVNLYIHEVNGNPTYFIEFRDLSVLLGVSSDKIAPVDSIHPEATPYLWGGDVVGAIDNALQNGSVSIPIRPVILLLLYAELRNLYQPE